MADGILGGRSRHRRPYDESIRRSIRSRHRAGFERLRLSWCDVLVEDLRPDTAARLGLGAERLRQRPPRLVHCSISGFGREGPPRAG
ncbi:MAG: hypothetical protein GEU68_14750 [Actinobacteria bacterium]|nr:hypothetical protein [Actinomycetota bacterium]